MTNAKGCAKRLSIVWIVSFVIVGIVSNAYVLYQRTIIGVNPIRMLSSYQIISFLLIVLYFLPLLKAIIRYSKLAHMRLLHKIAGIVFAMISIWSFFMFVFMVIELLAL